LLIIADNNWADTELELICFSQQPVNRHASSVKGNLEFF
jgi:hypothetical protein